jgi:hypothetical protein
MLVCGAGFEDPAGVRPAKENPVAGGKNRNEKTFSWLPIFRQTVM